jgi:hypothetical protein
LDGARNVTYDGPVKVEGVDVPAFKAPSALAGREPAIVSDVLNDLRTIYLGTGVEFTTNRPNAGTVHSTIYVGGNDSRFAQYGSFLGLAEDVDVGNKRANDNALVFTDNVAGVANVRGWAASLADVISHETGHLLGFEHDTATESGMPLDVVADKFGAKLGNFNGVEAYSNGTPGNNSNLRSKGAGVDTGVEWQCAEYVNRYYYVHYGLNLRATWSGNAKDFYDNYSALKLSRYTNGRDVKPQMS